MEGAKVPLLRSLVIRSGAFPPSDDVRDRILGIHVVQVPSSAIAAVLDLPSFASVRRDCNKKGDLVQLIYH